jgi:hypothetical protein
MNYQKQNTILYHCFALHLTKLVDDCTTQKGPWIEDRAVYGLPQHLGHFMLCPLNDNAVSAVFSIKLHLAQSWKAATVLSDVILPFLIKSHF